ncbi:sulfurtransferase [Halosimplex rubrum]|uniref:Sulfurtransferase n=1 Tax=Halosimplex rubrum TaxID=869889 RepID=A0A7D5NZ94_9EURY|nr:sulfurtransferase [Halosimplex rubrum]QLH77006.1 sulfurtransferase [Halosimplex rubrum]
MSEIVVPADRVADRLDEVRIVDTRDAWEFEGIGHVPGAVSVPFDSFRADEHAAEDGAGGESGGSGAEESGDGQGMLPGADAFADLMSEAGIENDDRIVAYDDTHGVFAARFLVTAELYGHDPERLHLLDGDFSAWRLDHETTSEVAEFERSTYEVDPPAETPLVGIDAVASATDDPDTVVVDTREAWEFEEGHIPGAVRLDWRELVDDETRGLKPRAEIESILDERGIAPDKRIVLYCNTARRISHTYTVLRHLGYPDLAFYEGSLTEWEADGRELETGA